MIDAGVITGDCADVLRSMPDASVDAVVTDPPYGVGYRYNGAFDDSSENWVASVAPTLADMLRVSRGPVLWFGAAPTIDRDRALLSPERMLIWAPRFTLSSSRKDGVFFRWQPVYCWRLGNAAKLEESEAGDGLHSDVLTEPTEARRSWWNHPATKPLALMERLVRVAPPGGAVLDPFAGSGTTLIACRNTGRVGIGIERDPEYAAIAERRLRDEIPVEETPLFADAL